MVAKFSSSSRLNCMRCDLNSASASMSLITPAIALSSPAETLEFGGKLIEADRDDVRVLSDPAGSDVLDPVVVGHLDAAVPDDPEYGGGQRRQQAVDFPVPVREVLGHLPEHRPERRDGVAYLARWHDIGDAPEPVAVPHPDRPAQLDAKVAGRPRLSGLLQQVGQPAYLVPVPVLDQPPAEHRQAADHLGPPHRRVRVSIQQLLLPLRAPAKRTARAATRTIRAANRIVGTKPTVRTRRTGRTR